MTDRLYRSRDDRMLAGVAGGLADLWDADPSLIRIIWALLVVFTGGIALIVYVVMAIVVPEEDTVRSAGVPPAVDHSAPAAGGSIPGWGAPSSAGARREARRAARAERRAAGESFGGVPGSVVGGAILILIGAFFLVREFLPAVDFDVLWPLGLVGVGVVLLVSALTGGRDKGGAA